MVKISRNVLLNKEVFKSTPLPHVRLQHAPPRRSSPPRSSISSQPSRRGTNGSLISAGHGDDEGGALFRPLHHSRGDSAGGMMPDGVYKLVRDYSTALGFTVGAHSLRSTAATNALEHGADLAEVQQMLGHANIATTRLYDQRDSRPEHSRDLLSRIIQASNSETSSSWQEVARSIEQQREVQHRREIGIAAKCEDRQQTDDYKDKIKKIEIDHLCQRDQNHLESEIIKGNIAALFSGKYFTRARLSNIGKAFLAKSVAQ